MRAQGVDSMGCHRGAAHRAARAHHRADDTEPEATALAQQRAAESTGRPLGSGAFVTRLEQVLRRTPRWQMSGRKKLR
jgi:hypothetical protein